MHVIADQAQMKQMVDRLAGAIARDKAAAADEGAWALIGIRSRGDALASELSRIVRVDHVGTLDITLYRDDLSEIGAQPIVRTSEIPFAIDGVHVVLVDDVLMTGRSVRAGLQLLMDLGRPRRVWLSVLVDRGGRELPIRPDHVALDLSEKVGAKALRQDQCVDVLIRPIDDRDEIVVRSLDPQEARA